MTVCMYRDTHTLQPCTTPHLAEGIMVDIWRDFWIRETGTGQQVAQLRDRYMMMMMMICLKHFSF